MSTIARYLKQLSVVFFMLLTLAAQAAPITECDFDEDGTFDNVQIVENSRAVVTFSADSSTETVRFGQRFRSYSCVDRNDDGAPEIIARKTVDGRVVREVFYVVGKPSGGGINKVCRSVRELQRCEIWKSMASHHITDQRASSTSFITTRGCPGFYSGCISVYDGDGNQIHSMGQYFPTGVSYDNRHYGCHGCGDCKRASSVASSARANTGSSAVYLKDSAGNCARQAAPPANPSTLRNSRTTLEAGERQFHCLLPKLHSAAAVGNIITTLPLD
jgi:hypothetical protein